MYFATKVHQTVVKCAKRFFSAVISARKFVIFLVVALTVLRNFSKRAVESDASRRSPSVDISVWYHATQTSHALSRLVKLNFAFIAAVVLNGWKYTASRTLIDHPLSVMPAAGRSKEILV